MKSIVALMLAVLSLACTRQSNSGNITATEILLGDHGTLHWLDNRRIAIEADHGERCDPGNGSLQVLNRLAIFDTDTQKLNWIGPVGVSGFCYASGNVFFRVRKHADGQCPTLEFDDFMGPLGTELPAGQKLRGGLDRYTCQPLQPLPEWAAAAEAANKNTTRFVRLMPEDGLLELRASDDKWKDHRWLPFRLHRKTAAGYESVWLDDLKEIVSGHVVGIFPTVKFFPHKGAYLLYVDSWLSPFPDNEMARLWWLYPDGRIEEFLTYIRTSDWPLANPSSVIPMKTATLLGGGKKDASSGISQDGLYNLGSGKGLPLRLMAGSLGERAVSPDGCRLAFGIDTRRNQTRRDQYRLHIIDICKDKP